MTHYFLGWHTTLTLGSISAAAAAARLLKLDAARASAAISIATSMASGLKLQLGTMTKPIHAGLAAKNGILAAAMAESGVTAAEDNFEGERGFVALFAGTPNQASHRARSSLSMRWCLKSRRKILPTPRPWMRCRRALACIICWRALWLTANYHSMRLNRRPCNARKFESCFRRSR